MTEIIKDGYTRVSTMISPFTGYGNIPEHILENACTRGTIVHEIIEGIIDGIGVPELNQIDKNHEISGYIESFMEWYKDYSGFHAITPERWYDEELMITGKCDVVLINPVTGERMLIDFKTSQKENKVWKAQGSFYAYLFENIEKLSIDKIVFVKLCRIGGKALEFHYEKQTDLVKWYAKFYNALNS